MLGSTSLFAVPVLLLTLCLVIGFEVRRGLRLDFVSAFSASYAFMYVIIPIVILLNPSYVTEDFKHSSQFLNAQEHIPEAAAWIAGFYIIFAGVYSTLNRWAFLKQETVRWIESVDRDRLLWFSVAFLFVGVGSFLVYASGLGGPVAAIINAQLKRSGIVRGEGPYLFFKHFIRIVFVAAYLIYAIRPFKRGLRLLRPILLMISLLAVVLAGVIYASRALFVVALAPFIAYPLFTGGRGIQSKDLIRLTILTTIALLSISVLRPLLVLLADFQGWGYQGVQIGVDVFIRDIVRGFGIPFISLLVVLNEVTLEDAMAGGGILKTIPSILPGRLLGLGSDLLTINNFNTVVFGYEYATSEYTYQVTAGMLAYYHYEFARFGLLVGGGIAGFVTTVMNSVLERVRHITPYLITMLYFVFKVPAYMMNGDPATLIRNDIIIIVAVFFLFVILPRIPVRKPVRPLVPTVD